MIDNTILEAIKSFCEQHVSPKIKLMAPNDNDVREYRLMHPNVFIGWLPPPNQLDDVPLQFPDGFKSAIPAMVIGMDEGEDDGSEAAINVRITFIVYKPGLYIPSEEDPDTNRFIPNFQGYKDLLNLIHICRSELARHIVIGGGKTSVQKPFRWGMYPQQPFAYWAGWLTFRATALPLPYIGEAKSLLD